MADLRDRVRTNTTHVGTLYYSYDQAGNLTNQQSSTANGVWVGYQYDALNRLSNVVDNRRDSYWASDDGTNTPELVLDLKGETTFNVVRLREYLPLGQRVEGFALDVWQGDKWVEFASGTSIGNCRLVRVQPVTTSRLRLRITKAPACPAIAEVGIFLEPKQKR